MGTGGGGDGHVTIMFVVTVTPTATDCRMMSLSPVLARFVETMNAHDSDGFAEGAEVQEENRVHRGTAEIKEWIEGAFANCKPILEVRDVGATGAGAVITGPATGIFSGSPLLLPYHLTLADGSITAPRCVV